MLLQLKAWDCPAQIPEQRVGDWRIAYCAKVPGAYALHEQVPGRVAWWAIGGRRHRGSKEGVMANPNTLYRRLYGEHRCTHCVAKTATYCRTCSESVCSLHRRQHSREEHRTVADGDLHPLPPEEDE